MKASPAVGSDSAQSARRNSKFTILPLTGQVGAELLDIDLTQPQSEQTWKEIGQAFSDYGVIFFRDQKLTPADQLDFAHHFGETSSSPRVKHVDGYDQLGIVAKEPDEHKNIGGFWHTDQSARKLPVRGSILYCKEAPAYGGDTCFISMSLAYEALSDGLKRTLEGLNAVHNEAMHVSKDDREREYNLSRLDVPPPPRIATHKVVISLPESGKKALYVNPGLTSHFDGWTKEESDSLMKFLFQHAQKPEFMCRFRWRAGSMAMWDNYQTWHYAVNDYHGQRRFMHRTTVMSAPWG